MCCLLHGKGEPPKRHELRQTRETETFYATTDKQKQEVSKDSEVNIGKGINFCCDNSIIDRIAFVN